METRLIYRHRRIPKHPTRKASDNWSGRIDDKPKASQEEIQEWLDMIEDAKKKLEDGTLEIIEIN